jgi:hypothetical protein
LIRRRSSGSTASGGRLNALDATKVCRSSPDWNASISPASSDSVAMIRISIWL